MQRRSFVIGVGSALVAPLVRAQALEKPKLTIAVGGKNLLYYLPLTIAESLGYFKNEGLDVTINDFAGGAQSLRALVGGSVDVVSGAFEHTVNMQAKGQKLRAFVLMGRAPQIVLGVNPSICESIKWNAPSFRTEKGFFATFNMRAKESVQLVFHLGARIRPDQKPFKIADPKGLIKWLGKDRALVTLGAGRDIPANRAAFEAIVRAWIRTL